MDMRLVRLALFAEQADNAAKIAGGVLVGLLRLGGRLAAGECHAARSSGTNTPALAAIRSTVSRNRLNSSAFNTSRLPFSSRVVVRLGKLATPSGLAGV